MNEIMNESLRQMIKPEAKIQNDEACVAVNFMAGRTDKLSVIDVKSDRTLFYVRLDEDGVMHFDFTKSVNIQLESANCFRVEIRK